MSRASEISQQRRKAQAERRDFTAFRFLVAEPADMGDGSTPVTLPGRARLAVSHSEGCEAGQVTVEVGTRLPFTVPDLEADQVHRGTTGERGMDVMVENDGAPAGTVTLYVVDPLGRHVPIATATFA